MLRMPRAIRLSFNVSNSFLIKNEVDVNQYIKNSFVQCRASSVGTSSTNDFDVYAEEKPKKRKSVRVPKITLINQDESVRIVFLEEAKNIAKRHNLHLVQVDDDSKGDRNTYKLLDFHDVLKYEDKVVDLNEGDHKFKTTKLFTLKSKIEQHDLAIKIVNMNKVLKKNHKVKVLITHPTGGHEEIVKTLKKNVLGTFSEEKLKKDRTTLVFSPSSNDESEKREKQS